MLAMLKQENQQLQIQQAELMDAMKYQRASLEAKVHDLQRELEQQAFRTPESDESVKRQLEMTVDEPSTSRALRRRTCGWCAEKMLEMEIGSRDSPWCTWMT